MAHIFLGSTVSTLQFGLFSDFWVMREDLARLLFWLCIKKYCLSLKQACAINTIFSIWLETWNMKLETWN